MTEATNQEAQTVRDFVKKITEGSLTSVSLVSHCLEVVDKTDADIGAWLFFIMNKP